MLISKNTINTLQKEILLLFAALRDSQEFYLAGGTALADFYLGHRKSFDLDLFSDRAHQIS